MNPKTWLVALVVLVPLAFGCQQASRLSASTRPNAINARAFTPAQAEVALGVRLFFDPRLSRTNRVSCGGCHVPKAAFTDGRTVGVGVDGRTGARNTPTVIGAKHAALQFWDGRAASLEEQALGPIFNPLEMDADLDELVAELSAIPMYPRLFGQAYGTGVSKQGIAKAIAAFERALESDPSPYDRWLAGDDNALSPAAKRGQEIFAVKAHCGDCHKGIHLTDNDFHNLGWGFDGPQGDPGRGGVTKDPADFGKFKTPTLRNVAETGPYFHDGGAKTLEQVVQFYNMGGRANPNLDPKIQALGLSAQEKSDLVEFMKALSAPTNLKAIAQEAVEKREVRF